jgi:hypothetical protein
MTLGSSVVCSPFCFGQLHIWIRSRIGQIVDNAGQGTVGNSMYHEGTLLKENSYVETVD